GGVSTRGGPFFSWICVWVRRSCKGAARPGPAKGSGRGAGGLCSLWPGGRARRPRTEADAVGCAGLLEPARGVFWCAVRWLARGAPRPGGGGGEAALRVLFRAVLLLRGVGAGGAPPGGGQQAAGAQVGVQGGERLVGVGQAFGQVGLGAAAFAQQLGEPVVEVVGGLHVRGVPVHSGRGVEDPDRYRGRFGH